VAKLLIFRGETQVQEHELKEQTVRIGRGTQNDVVLEDPGKGVSRHHAEIRFEGGRYTLVDLQSQNGIWVSGTRVPSVVLEPGVTAALGPFRLMMQAPVPVSAITAVPALPGDPATELTQLSSRTAAPLNLDSLSAPVEKAAAMQPAEKVPSPKPTDKAPAAKPVVDKVPAPRTQKQTPVQKAPPPAAQKPLAPEQAWYTNPRIIGPVAVVLVLGLSAVIGYMLMRNSASAAWDPTAAQQLIASGKCQEALDTQITPALRKNPNDARALMLRDQCNKPAEPAAPTTTIPVTPPVASVSDRLNEAEALLLGNVVADCQKALLTIDGILAEDSNDQRANDLKTRANACINPIKPPGPPPVVTVEKPATPLPPSKGGLDVIQGETEKAYKARMDAAKKRYDDAVALLNSQKYLQAFALFGELMNDVPSGYLDLQQHRDEARTGMRNDAKAALTSAESAESRGELDSAWDQIRRARQLDASNPQVESTFQRIQNARFELGRTKCNEGTVAKIYGQTTKAVAAFSEAVKLLQGSSDPCLPVARDYLQKTVK
jgi:tetratricopeptide (TPR) repeat protein